MSVLFVAGLALSLCAAAGALTGRLKQHQGSGLHSVAAALYSVSAAQIGSLFWACLCAALSAIQAWLWWHGGGGDDTKRRLRKWGRAFSPTRRTAPAAS